MAAAACDECPPSEDARNVLALLRRAEARRTEMDPDAKYARYRPAVVDFIVCVVADTAAPTIAAHAAVAYFDAVITQYAVDPKRLQLVALACVWVSIKFHGPQHAEPTLRWLYDMGSGVYAEGQIECMEREVLKGLDWRLVVATPYEFAHACDAHVVDETDTIHDVVVGTDAVRVRKCGQRWLDFFAHVALQEYEYAVAAPSSVGAAIVMATRCEIKILPAWPERLAALTERDELVVTDICGALLRILAKIRGAAAAAPGTPPGAARVPSVARKAESDDAEIHAVNKRGLCCLGGARERIVTVRVAGGDCAPRTVACARRRVTTMWLRQFVPPGRPRIANW